MPMSIGKEVQVRAVHGWRDLARWDIGVRHVGIGDLAWALVLSAGAIVSVSGVKGPVYPHEGFWASVAVLLMTVPVAFARRQPVVAAAVLAAGAAFNWLVVGDMVRCGAALPAAFYVAYTVGSRSTRWRDTGVGIALVAANVTCQAYSDPQLGRSVLVYMVPIALAFMAAGRLLQVRNAAVAALRARTAQLRVQREQNAALAVAADQARIADDLHGYLHDQVGEIAATARTGRATLVSEPGETREAKEAFVAIQDTGRETLTHMRGVVASLREGAPTQPQPVLAQLDRLLGEATTADARLQVVGDPRLLPPGVELSGYRIVEHLLVAFEDDPSGHIDVVLTFGPDAVELALSGPVARHGDTRAALAAATERAVMHGGALRTQASGGLRQAVVSLPLAARHA
jgi:signal transduction histidine kinase